MDLTAFFEPRFNPVKRTLKPLNLKHFLWEREKERLLAVRRSDRMTYHAQVLDGSGKDVGGAIHPRGYSEIPSPGTRGARGFIERASV